MFFLNYLDLTGKRVTHEHELIIQKVDCISSSEEGKASFIWGRGAGGGDKLYYNVLISHLLNPAGVTPG